MFSYYPGPGDTSWPAIVNAAKLSGLYGPDPLVRDTNDYDPPPNGGGWHVTGNAVDFGDDQENGSPQQDAFAAWVAEAFGPYSLEIIHVNQDGSTVEWKDGVQRPRGWYGRLNDNGTIQVNSTLGGHINHVHWAISTAGLNAGLANFNEGEFIMDAEAKAAFAALNAKIDQGNFQQMYGAGGKPNPLGLVGQTDIFKAVQTHGGWLLKILGALKLKP